MTLEIRILDVNDVSVLNNVASEVFDNPIDDDAARTFLADQRNHMVVAIDDAAVVGFISAIHYLHPDKPQPELWINEVGVAPAYQRQGIGKRMIAMLLQLAKELGCGEAWVLTEKGNTAARTLYSSTGGLEDRNEPIMFSFDLK